MVVPMTQITILDFYKLAYFKEKYVSPANSPIYFVF